MNFSKSWTDIVTYRGHVTYRHITDGGRTQYMDEVLEAVPYICKEDGWQPNMVAVTEAVAKWQGRTHAR